MSVVQPLVQEKNVEIISGKNKIRSEEAIRLQNDETCTKLSNFRQIRTAFIANAAVINSGLVYSFSAIALPQLEATDSDIIINSNEASWIASISSLATPPGCILGGILMERLGRRAALFILSVPCILGWLLLGSTGLLASSMPAGTQLPVIYLARILQGLGTGITAGTVGVYTSEVTSPKLRGSLCSLASISLSTGLLLGYTLGALFIWPIMSLCASLLPLFIVILAVIYLPETPTWLLQHKTIDEARKSLQKLRDQNTSLQLINIELSNLSGIISNEKLNKINILTNFSTLKPLLLIMYYFFCYQFSSVSVLMFYSVNIIEQSGTQLDGYVCAVILGSVLWICTVVGCYLSHHINRRTLTLFSGFCSGLPIICLATHNYYFYHDSSLTNIDIYFWKIFPIICLILFFIFYSLGFLLIPWILLGEIFPAKVRGFLGGLSACFSHIFLFIAVKSFPFLLDNLLFYGTFWLYGTIVVTGSIILFILLPETKGRTLLEIETYFKN